MNPFLRASEFANANNNGDATWNGASNTWNGVRDSPYIKK